MDDGTNLRNVIGRIAEKIRGRHSGGPSMNEENTKSKLINPILHALGWDVQGEDVEQEYRRRPKDNPVDYSMKVSQTRVLFVEAKALGQKLFEDKGGDQVLVYAFRSGEVKWCVLTDGDHYKLYNAGAQIRPEDRLFRETRLSKDEVENAAEILEWFSHENMQDQRIIEAAWREHFVDRQVVRAIEGMVSTGDPGLIELISQKVRSVDPQEIADAVRRVIDIAPEPSADDRPPSGGGNGTGVVFDKNRVVAMARKSLLKHEDRGNGRRKPLNCKELDAICSAVGLRPYSDRRHVRKVLRNCQLHPPKYAKGDARLVTIAGIG